LLFEDRRPFSLTTMLESRTGDDLELRRAEEEFFAARGLAELLT
jgi:hypothetical protein